MKYIRTIICGVCLLLSYQSNAGVKLTIDKFKCNAHLPKACVTLSEIYENGIGVKVDIDKAQSYIKKACEYGDSDSCYKIGLKEIENDHGNLSDAIKNFTKACDKKKGSSCFVLGRIYKESIEFLDLKKSINYFKKACDLNDSSACLELGNIYHNDENYQDKKLAFNFYDKSCHLNNAKACEILGELFQEGDGTTKDPKKAHVLFESTCQNSKDADSCFDVAMNYKTGKVVKKDDNLATTYFREAADTYDMECTLKNAESCYKLGMMYIKGYGIRVDYNLARTYLAPACDLGEKRACEFLERIKNNSSKK